MNTKHTPGPWTCELDCIRGLWPKGPDGEQIANIPWHPEAVANSQLIAAAPALLEVCHAMATEIDRYCTENNIGGGFGVTHKAWAVIASAEGKQTTGAP